jgi:hypothetical protein
MAVSAAAANRPAAASSTGARWNDSSWMRAWKRSTAAGNGDQPNHMVVGLSASGSAAPVIPASTAARRSGGAAAVRAPMTARLTRPSGTATRMNRRWLPQSPQCGIASRTKCEATPAANAGTGRRASAPISAPDKT